MDIVIEKAEELSYSDKDISRLLNDEVVILKYPELSDLKDIDELFKKSLQKPKNNGFEVDCACILYMSKQNYGHWTSLIRTIYFDKKEPEKLCVSYEVFDPYGIFPDTELNYIPDQFRKESGQDYPHLSYLLFQKLSEAKQENATSIGGEGTGSGISLVPSIEVIYNKHRLQNESTGMKDINTCGRWCSYRCFLAKSGISLEDFILMFIGQKNTPDYLISALTLLNR